MTAATQTQISADWIQNSHARTQVVGRDLGIDTMRGIAILMVIGIHSMPQPLDPFWGKLVDAALRPCVPIFLFASGYLTALSGRVVLWRRIKTALIPYAIAFVAAYIYMAWHNPAMDHRITTTIARFVLAYVFVYYYVFVYIGCTVCLWLVLRISDVGSQQNQQRLAILLALSILFGLVAGSYIDPLLLHRGFSESFVQEVRLRDIPFWFSFVALGALVGTSSAGLALRDSRLLIAAAALFAYIIYAAVRISGIGDAADYDSTAFFAYAALISILLLGLHPRSQFLAAIGSGSYFIYLWHIFVIMILRDHFSLQASGAVIDFAITYATTAVISISVLLIVRRVASARVSRWLGA
jgi:surface polysaccharide O-acyltransferase-like enzyme